MQTDQRRVGGMKSHYVVASPALSFIAALGLAEKVIEGLVRASIRHLVEDFICLGEEVAFVEFAILKAPGVTLNFVGGDFMLAQEVPDFLRAAVDELSSQFDGRICGRVMQGEDAAAGAVFGLEHSHLHAMLCELNGRDHACETSADDEDVSHRTISSAPKRMSPSGLRQGSNCNQRVR